MAAGVAVFFLSSKACERSMCVCVGVGVDLPLGVLAVNSGSKQNVSSGLPAAGLNGGWSSLLYSFCRRHTPYRKHTYMLETEPHHRLFAVCEHMREGSQDPSQINPLPSLYIPVQPIASCRLLNTHAGLLVHTQWELALCPDTHIHTNIVGVAKTDGQNSPSQPFVRCESSTEAGELHVCVSVWVCEKWEGCVCAHIPVDGGKESVAFDLLHSVGSGP